MLLSKTVQHERMLYMKYQGLNAQQVEGSRKQYGTNALTTIPPEPLWN